MGQREDEERLLNNMGCWFFILLLLGGIITFIADFWYIFIGILVVIILVYKNKK